MKINNDYENLREELKGLKMRKDNFSSIQDMNIAINEFIEFYRMNGIELSVDDFKDVFGENITNYQKMNEHIYKYMTLFFDNINNLDSYEFIELLFTMEELGVDSNSLIMDEISAMMNNFNRSHKNIFNNIMDEMFLKYKELGIPKVLFSYDNIDELIKLLDEKEKSQNELSNLVQEFNEMLGTNLNNKEIYDVIEEVIRFRIFKELFNRYHTYEKDNRKFISDISDVDDIVFNESLYFNKLMNKEESYKDKVVSKGKRDKLKKSIYSTAKKIVDLKNQLENMKKSYFLGFYKKYKIDLLEEEFNINLCDSENFLGLFKYGEVPYTLNFNVLNIINCDSQRFDRLSSLALKIYNNLLQQNNVKKLSKRNNKNMI